MKKTNKNNLETLMKRAKSNPNLDKEFQKDPMAFLKKNNINTDDLPPEVMEKVSGGLSLIDCTTTSYDYTYSYSSDSPPDFLPFLGFGKDSKL